MFMPPLPPSPPSSLIVESLLPAPCKTGHILATTVSKQYRFSFYCAPRLALAPCVYPRKDGTSPPPVRRALLAMSGPAEA
eukprot:scaffold31903_cov104-Isochrysis_galbana.AAC.4